LHPTAAFYNLLGQVQRRNPKWLREAQESFRKAIQLDPQNPDLRVELARLQERAGDAEGAKASYRAVLERRPDDAAAANALRRLERYAAASRSPKQQGWLSRLFASLGLGRR
jgi:thioredoxin-like negative regulator of GroEL